MPSDFLIQFHKRHFPEGNVPIYSKEVFYRLVDEINRFEENNITKVIKKYEEEQQSNCQDK